MKKLYFKKLFSIIAYAVICYLIYLVGFNFLSLLANWFENIIVRFAIFFGIPLIIVLIRIYNKRFEMQELRRAYLTQVNRECLIFKDEWRYMIKFSHFSAEICAFITIFLPLSMFIGFARESFGLIGFLVGLLFLIGFVTVSVTTDFVLWLLVHNTWRKGV